MSSNFTDETVQIIHMYSLSMYVLIITVGCIWNGTLVFMFARHKEIRTTANTMTFNLAVCDAVNLLVVAPVRYNVHYPNQSLTNIDLCRCIFVFHHTILGASALSVVALSIQRFSATVSHLKFHKIFISKNKKLVTIIYILFIWTMSFLTSIPAGLIWDIYGYICGTYENKYATNVLIMTDFIYFCVFLPFLMFFFNLATARRLKGSLSMLVGGVNSTTREVVRKRSANVVTLLSLFFLLTHLPYFSWCLYAYWANVNRKSVPSLIMECIGKHLLFLNSCFNPIALYMTSSTFRKLFRRYFCCSKEKRQVVSSVQCS